MYPRFFGIFCLMLGLALPVWANNYDHGHQTAKTVQPNAATKAYQAANAKMHASMDIPFTGDADRDFIMGMIPHHQGAVEMAKIVLQYGKDAEIRKLAQDIIQAQEKEIAWMQNWLQNNSKP